MNSEQNSNEVLTVLAMDGQYLVEASSDRNDIAPLSANGLTMGETEWLAILTGTQYGPVQLTLEVRKERPADMETSWDMVVERDILIGSNGLEISDLYSSMSPHKIALTNGRYRMRIHVLNRSEAHRANNVSSVHEEHLIQVWQSNVPHEYTMLLGPDQFARESYGIDGA